MLRLFRAQLFASNKEGMILNEVSVFSITYIVYMKLDKLNLGETQMYSIV